MSIDDPYLVQRMAYHPGVSWGTRVGTWFRLRYMRASQFALGTCDRALSVDGGYPHNDREGLWALFVHEEHAQKWLDLLAG